MIKTKPNYEVLRHISEGNFSLNKQQGIEN